MFLLSTRAHGVLDYLVSGLLLASPWLLGFAEGGAETWVPVVFGAAGILYSLATDYELGVLRAIPMPAHLVIDMLSGALLAASPWLFGFADQVWAPHVIFGLTEVLVPTLTNPHPKPDARGLHAGREAAADHPPHARPPHRPVGPKAAAPF